MEGELSEEVEFHLEMEARKYRAQGMDAGEAARRARREFGGVERVKDECRDARGIRLLEAVGQDVRYALRGFRRTPGFAVTVIATIAVGLGLNTALFTVFNAYVLRTLAVWQPESLYQIAWRTRTSGTFFAEEDTRRVRESHPGFEAVVAFKPVFAKSGDRTLFGNRVSPNYFPMLGVPMTMGRPFGTGGVESETVAVLSYSAWKNKFAADPLILGKPIPMFGSVYEVVGVAGAGFDGVGQIPADFWIPARENLPSGQGAGQTVVGRLAAGVTPGQAQAALLVAARQWTAGLPEAERVVSVVLRPNATTIPLMPETLVLFVPVGLAFVLVLLIACANVASMMLGRSMARQREIGIRLSLGAGRMRLIGQLLVEGVVLAVPAAVAGFWVSGATLRLVENLVRSTMPPMISKIVRFVDLSPDFRVFLYLFGAALVATVIFALFPAVQVTRTNLQAASRSGSRRLRQVLVVAQVTVCALLLTCAGVLLRASGQMAERDPGIRTAGVMVVALNQSVGGTTVAALRTQPWSEKVAVAWRAPLTGPLRGISAAGAEGAPWTRAGYNFVSPDYFDVLRIPILRGRNFTAAEASGEGAVTVVSEATAKLFWPGQNPLGQTVRMESTGWQMDKENRMPRFRQAEVVGVAPDVVSGMVMEGKDATCLYFPMSETGAQNDTLLVRLNPAMATAGASLESFLDEKAASAILRVVPMDELFATQIYPFRVTASISTLLGLLSLALTLSGLYGVLSFLVAQRTKEIGVRMALGATGARVVRMVVMQSARLASVGAVLGGALAAGVSILFASEVPGVNAFDPVAYAAGGCAVLLAALGAAFFPSKRAVRIEPSSTLRMD
jgi:predicted permease